MKWIKDRNPQSPGMYAVRLPPFYEVKSFTFGYFDGTGWQMPSQASDDPAPYRNRPEWSVIDWGGDRGEIEQLMHAFGVS